MEETRRCPRCKQDLPLDSFYTGTTPYCKPCMSEYQKERRTQAALDEGTSEGNDEWSILRRAKNLGLDLLDVLQAHRVWDGTCNGCSVDMATLPRAVCLDHDHTTGVFRGFLCMGCNTALGHVQDRTDVLLGLINYLNNNK
jgi:hypothetical protein